VTAYVSAAAVFGPEGFVDTELGRPGLVTDELLADALVLRGLRPLSRTARLAMSVAARVLPPGTETGPHDALVLGSARSSVAPLADFVQVAAEHGADRVFPMAFPNTVVSVHVGYVATLLGCTGPALTLCGEHAGLEAVVEACGLLSAGRADRVLAIAADAAEPTVLAGHPDAAEGAAAIRLSTAPEGGGSLAAITGCWTAASLDQLPEEVRSSWAADAADRFGAAAGASRVAAAALAVAADGRSRTVVGPSGVRGVAAIRLGEAPPG
jgi:Beta-ketoacyl synthase, N-terminal domain